MYGYEDSKFEKESSHPCQENGMDIVLEVLVDVSEVLLIGLSCHPVK
jgi:hypothetical protein